MKQETIIFVHGASHGKWCSDKYFKETFSKKGFEVVTFNLPRHDKPGKVKGIVSNLKNPPIIVGHSMGGLVIQKFLETNTVKK